MLTCEFCGEKRESVKMNEYGVRLCHECSEMYSEDPLEYLAALNVDELQEIDKHYRAEGW